MTLKVLRFLIKQLKLQATCALQFTCKQIVVNTCCNPGSAEVKKGFQQQKWPSSLKVTQVIAICAIRSVTYDFLLVFSCNYVSILYCFRYIISYFPTRGHVTLSTFHSWVIYHARTSTRLVSICVLNFKSMHSKNIIGAPKFKEIGHVNPSRPLWEYIGCKSPIFNLLTDVCRLR